MHLKHNVGAAIFDLDGTLYDSKIIDIMNINAAIEAISQTRNISVAEAESLFNAARINQNSQSLNPVSVTLKRLDIPTEKIFDAQMNNIHASNALSIDLELSNLLEELSTKIKIALYTNTNSVIAEQILDSIGVRTSVFMIIRAGQELDSPKPNGTELCRLIAELNEKPESCVMIGDRWEVDIAPAIEIGAQYVHVNGVADVKNWIITQLKH